MLTEKQLAGMTKEQVAHEFEVMESLALSAGHTIVDLVRELREQAKRIEELETAGAVQGAATISAKVTNDILQASHDIAGLNAEVANLRAENAALRANAVQPGDLWFRPTGETRLPKADEPYLEGREIHVAGFDYKNQSMPILRKMPVGEQP